MPSPNIQRPAGVNVGVNNPGSNLYIGNITAGLPANENTDGSIRFRIAPGETETYIEFRSNGVWNDGGLRISPNLVYTESLGHVLNEALDPVYTEQF